MLSSKNQFGSRDARSSRRPAIVVPAFQRSHSLSRLLKSLEHAEVPRGTTLVISLEGGATEDVQQVARNFDSDKFEVEIIEHESSLGLRKHILQCGEQARRFGAVVVLEDDLVVDRYFYHFAVNGLTAYENSAVVAGIGLYAYEYNEFANLPFTAMDNGYSAYPIMVPCSWGQCWTSSQWESFRTWLEGKTESYISRCDLIPHVVRRWPASSWKKYFAVYLAETNRFFINPYTSYTTNFAGAGTHVKYSTSLFHVAMPSPERSRPALSFPPMENPDIAYDQFMEACGAIVFRSLGLARTHVEINLYGTKTFLPEEKSYLVSPSQHGEVIKRLPATLRPIDANLVFPGYVGPSDAHFFYLCRPTAKGRLTGKVSERISDLQYFVRFRALDMRFFIALASALFAKIWSRIRGQT